VDSQLQDSSKPLISKAEELIECRKTQKNACSVVETLELALPGLSINNKTWSGYGYSGPLMYFQLDTFH